MSWDGLTYWLVDNVHQHYFRSLVYAVVRDFNHNNCNKRCIGAEGGANRYYIHATGFHNTGRVRLAYYLYHQQHGTCLGTTLNPCSCSHSIIFVSRVAQTTQAEMKYQHLLPYSFERRPVNSQTAETGGYRHLLALVPLRLKKSIVYHGASRQGRDFFKHCSNVSRYVQQRGAELKNSSSPQRNKHPFRAEKRFSSTT